MNGRPGKPGRPPVFLRLGLRMSAKPRLSSVGYRHPDTASQGGGLKAIIAALSSRIPRAIGGLDSRGLFTAGRFARRPSRCKPTTLPYPSQTHDHIEIACVLSGRCLAQMGDKYFALKPGDVCIFTPGLEHSDTFVGRDCPYSLLWFTLGSQRAGAHLTTYSRRTGFNVVFVASCETVVSAPRLTKDILTAVSRLRTQEEAVIHLKACLLGLASVLLNHLVQKGARPQHDWRSRVIDDAVEFLKARYLENPSLSEVSNRVRLSPNYLCALFHKHTGQTIVGFLNGLRMKRAEELLLNSHRRMKEIAGETGFRSAHYFSRAFHRMHGVSPSAFREAHA